MNKAAWVLTYWLSRAALFLPRRLIPTTAGYAVAVVVADLCYLLFPSARRNLQANLRRVLPDEKLTRNAARAVFRNYGRYVIDLFQLPVLSRDAILRRVDFTDWRSLRGESEDARGTIFVNLHLGQWEMGAAALVASGHP